jgi:outer membrane immunogenic protein
MKTLAAPAFAAALALGAGTALAADFPADEFMGDGIVADDSGFDWDGFFVTVYGAYVFSDSFASSTGVGVSIGGNMTDGSFLYGGTATFGALFGGEADGQYNAQGVVRAGYLVTDDLLIYGLAGLGWETYHDAIYIPTGVGAEFAFADNLSLRLQYQANYITAEDVWSGSLSAGLSWYF